MSRTEVEHAAMQLSERDRELLVSAILKTLPAPDLDVSDEEVLRRDYELEAGLVEEVSHEEMMRRIEAKGHLSSCGAAGG
jgi:hypothetical protein